MTYPHHLTQPEPLPWARRLAPLADRAAAVRAWVILSDPDTLSWGQRQRLRKLRGQVRVAWDTLHPFALTYRARQTKQAMLRVARAVGLAAPAPRPILPDWIAIADDLACGPATPSSPARSTASPWPPLALVGP